MLNCKTVIQLLDIWVNGSTQGWGTLKEASNTSCNFQRFKSLFFLHGFLPFPSFADIEYKSLFFLLNKMSGLGKYYLTFIILLKKVCHVAEFWFFSLHIKSKMVSAYNTIMKATKVHWMKPRWFRYQHATKRISCLLNMSKILPLYVAYCKFWYKKPLCRFYYYYGQKVSALI